MKGRHTLNNFKRKIKDMDKEEQKQTLSELRQTLMEAKTKAQKGEFGPNVRLVRHQIAILKTVMNERGYGYNPR